MSHNSFHCNVGPMLCDEVVPNRVRDLRWPLAPFRSYTDALVPSRPPRRHAHHCSWQAFGVDRHEFAPLLADGRISLRLPRFPTSRSPQSLTVWDFRQVVSLGGG